ncbi:hypothetical protein [Methylobacterium sp. E-066]|uniref:hypothetical protein n=1 Tax=Methylobacterium sp. E-066 TaxID=2836584 RepID=UPI001FB9A8C4|nr:hypothetical protein [Methylobacterium sp. E-066]MCJ2143692.1 hypothetical protein [Methylobacterium sp. E-066]
MTASRNCCPYCGSPTTTAGHHIPSPSAFPLSAEQLVRGAGFILGLWHIRTKLPGEQVPSAEQLTLNLAAAVGVALPTHQHQVAILPNGKKVQTTLAPPRAIPTPGIPEDA